MSKMKKAASAPRRTKHHWQILRENHVYLLRSLNSGDILLYLYQEDVLNLDEYNKLKRMQDQERNRELLFKFEQRSRRQFQQFLLSLDDNGQSFVIDHLEYKTGLPLRKEFQVKPPIHLDPGIIEGGRSTSKVTDRSQTDDEKLSNQQAPVITPAEIETFFGAVRQGKLHEVRRLLEQGRATLDCRGKDRRTAVMEAVLYRQEHIFDFFLQSNCDISAVDDDNDNVFHYAYAESSEYMVKLFEKHKIDIECRGEDGWTPLMSAVEEGNLHLVEFLQNKGADINTVDDDGDNILHLACLGGHVEMVKYVLSLNITDIECRGLCGRTPLMYAVEGGHLPLVEFLQNKGADINTVGEDSNNILHVACLGGHVEMVKHVLSLNITDIECRGWSGRTPLMYAVEGGHLPLVEFLQNKGADINTVGEDSNNILHVACLGGHVEMVKHVLSLNITDIECRGEDGWTPLMLAVKTGHLPLVEFLQNKGADINTVGEDSNNILHVACLGGHVEMVKHVLSLNITDIECRGEDGWTPLMYAVEGGHLPLVEFLQNKGADINTVDDDGDNILHLACLGGHVEMVKYVLSLNITDIECRGLCGRTPLMYAVEGGHLPLVEFLQNKGADINTVGEDSNNILHVACLGGHVEMVKHVLSLNITDIECRGWSGRTPLMCAVETGHLPLVEFLQNKGADINTVGEDNYNILHVACIGGHVEMVKYLVTLQALKGFEKRTNKHGNTPLQVAQSKGYDNVVALLKNKKINNLKPTREQNEAE